MAGYIMCASERARERERDLRRPMTPHSPQARYSLRSTRLSRDRAIEKKNERDEKKKQEIYGEMSIRMDMKRSDVPYIR